MYEFAYNEVVEDSRQTMRARERAAMDRVIGMLRAAQEKGVLSRERIDAQETENELVQGFGDALSVN